jgi:hypothetical protein
VRSVALFARSRLSRTKSGSGSKPVSARAHDHLMEPWVVLSGRRRSGMPLSC